MKQKFSALDVRATVSDLRERIVGLRLQKVYDINPKTYLLKFSKPDQKELVLIESGIRIHITQFARDKSATPSNFCVKLRKHLGSRRLTNVRQVGVDRIIDFEFAGIGEGITYHIFAEFYASGNVILTDGDYTILSLLRVVQPKENERIAVGRVYDIESFARNHEPITRARLRELLSNASAKDTLKKILNSGLNYGQTMTEHVIRVAQLNPNLNAANDFDKSDDSPQLTALLAGFQEADRIIEESGKTSQKGYIILFQHSKQSSVADGGESKEDDLVTYNEFHPYLFEQHKYMAYKEFDSFDMAVDEYFSSTESQRLEVKQRGQEDAALKKLDVIKKEQQGRVKNLEYAQLENVQKARLIEANIELVDQTITVIRNAIASSMDWKDLGSLVAEEKKKNNPIALIIDGLKLESNQITLLLCETNEGTGEFFDSSDDDTDEERERTLPEASSEVTVKIDVDIHLTAFANARKYYDIKKQSAFKQEKTLAAAEKAFKSAEQKIKLDLKETKITATINKIRKPFWFEKFLWFISSENYLVIAGRDMQQNEIIVKRHLRKGDVYVHADLHGAASVVIKNPNDAQPIPPITLYQAGVMSVCQSKAWEAKVITSAYWVHAEQVSKTAPTGEYLTTGSFMIRGKKNFLPPVQLVYGFGLLFRLEEESIPNHLHERRMLRAENFEEEITQIEQETPEDIKELTSEQDGDHAITSSTGPASTTTQDQVLDSGSLSHSDDDDENLPDQVQAWDKYNLEEYGDDQDEYNQTETSEKSQQRKKYQSAKEKRNMKKQKQASPTDKTNLQETDQNESTATISVKEKEPQKVQPRGKKGKLKKIKEKYADQDEEERKLRLELLGSAKGPQPKGKKAKKEAQMKATAVTGIKEEKVAVASGKTEGDAKGMSDQNISDQQVGDIKDEEEAQEERQLLKEENVKTLGDDVENLSVLDTLTGNPLPEDILLFAVPVCAPYIALQKYKYKVKLIPGSMKTGQACKVATHLFLNDNNLTQREKELIKNVPDTEMISVMLGKSKLSAPNVEQSKKPKKKSSGKR